MRYRLAFLAVVALGVVQAETVFPDLLTFADGRPVKTAADWNRRREVVRSGMEDLGGT